MAVRLSPTVLAKFFSGYDYERYLYDPTNSTEDEFRRLVTARRWGIPTTARHRELGDYAVRLAMFFGKYERSGEHVSDEDTFVFDEEEEYDDEFTRLCAVMEWTPAEIDSVETEYNLAKDLGVGPAGASSIGHLATDPEGSTPIARFFLDQRCLGYRYRHRHAHIEYQELLRVMRADWERLNPNMRRAAKRRKKGGYMRTDEFLELRDGFCAAMEELFDLLLENRRGSFEESEIRPWELLIELFQVGEAPMSRGKAAKLLKGTYVNIFNFISLVEGFGPADNITEQRVWTADEQQKAAAIEHPDLGSLRRACKRGLTFPREAAKASGTLVLLLQHVSTSRGPRRP